MKIETLGHLMNSSDSPAPMLIENLLPGDGITMIHGHPRAGKSLVALEMMLAVATGTPAFDSSRLAVNAPAPVLYVSGEDGRARVTERVRLFLAGRVGQPAYRNLLLSFADRKDFEREILFQRLKEIAPQQGLKLIVFDSLRSLSASVDQGPAELQPLADYLRMLQKACGVGIVVVHHDSKVPSSQQNGRRALPLRASGGGIFSIADNPIHVERIVGGRVPADPGCLQVQRGPRCRPPALGDR